jgi:plastocyanin
VNRSRLAALAGLGAALLGAGALAAAGPGAAGSAARPIRAEATFSGGFSPGRIVVRAGAVVHVRNVDHLRHNVVADRSIHGRPAFRSGSPTSGNFQFRAPTRPGVYTFSCQVHGFMQGTLVVH